MVVCTLKPGPLQAELWGSKAKLTYKASSGPARVTSETLFQNRQAKCQKERILKKLKNDIHERYPRSMKGNKSLALMKERLIQILRNV